MKRFRDLLDFSNANNYEAGALACFLISGFFCSLLAIGMMLGEDSRMRSENLMVISFVVLIVFGPVYLTGLLLGLKAKPHRSKCYLFAGLYPLGWIIALGIDSMR